MDGECGEINPGRYHVDQKVVASFSGHDFGRLT